MGLFHSKPDSQLDKNGFLNKEQILYILRAYTKPAHGSSKENPTMYTLYGKSNSLDKEYGFNSIEVKIHIKYRFVQYKYYKGKKLIKSGRYTFTTKEDQDRLKAAVDSTLGFW